MPEIITKDIGLSFSKEELEIRIGEKLDLSNDFDEIAEMLENSHKAGEFISFGFSRFLYIDEISGEGGEITIYFG